MPEWNFRFTEVGEKDLNALDAAVRQRVRDKLLWFHDNFSSVVPSALGGKWRGFFKLRAGDWRIIYEIDERKREVVVHVIDLRDKVYKRKC